jgi:hypothetical protein
MNGEGMGGLRPPFFVLSTPMRSIGYAEIAAKELQGKKTCSDTIGK